MKTLKESLFDDNIKKHVGISDLKTAADLIVGELESKLNIKCNSTKIIDDGWYLCKVNNDENSISIYLDNLEKTKTISYGVSKEIPIHIRFTIEITQNDDDLRLEGINVGVIYDFIPFVSYIFTGNKLKQQTNIKNVHLTTKFEQILKHIVGMFLKFKKDVDEQEGFKQLRRNTIYYHTSNNGSYKYVLSKESYDILEKLSKYILK